MTASKCITLLGARDPFPIPGGYNIHVLCHAVAVAYLYIYLVAYIISIVSGAASTRSESLRLRECGSDRRDHVAKGCFFFN